MKQSCVGLMAAALFRVTAAQSTTLTLVPTPISVSSASVAWTAGPPSSISLAAASPVPSASSAAGPAICGQGFTYCGYILRDHQNFKEEDIVKAYCAGNKENCANGKTKTDPIQALYVCLPPSANPKPKAKRIKGRQITTTVIIGGDGLPVSLSSSVAAAAAVTSTVTAAASWGVSPVSPLVPVSSSASAVGGVLANGDGSCSAATATVGNRLELLCSCGGQCLNPLADHIGRCDVPCS
ncbi:hypothetical protein B0T26DRAFT_766547 [Lasiosphaeria miniovina]|uniref:Uncharacterized protein n=1 Tax=Lasiosphaeria miniovina TaxID=1954250 RepID=A0AA40E4J9_9PEZI|nr:uncharacterized protein B0T26DRAFT_766547 [Lasiosphaeria miniovina]KAK0727879.1 hypothetical protein B0T26DRAFT_766547 [Lasiosphaeria miniovina]